MQVKFLYQGHRVKVKVTGAKIPSIERQLVFLLCSSTNTCMQCGVCVLYYAFFTVAFWRLNNEWLNVLIFIIQWSCHSPLSLVVCSARKNKQSCRIRLQVTSQTGENYQSVLFPPWPMPFCPTGCRNRSEGRMLSIATGDDWSKTIWLVVLRQLVTLPAGVPRPLHLTKRRASRSFRNNEMAGIHGGSPLTLERTMAEQISISDESRLLFPIAEIQQQQQQPLA